jgi:hypothetical protein
MVSMRRVVANRVREINLAGAEAFAARLPAPAKSEKRHFDEEKNCGDD